MQEMWFYMCVTLALLGLSTGQDDFECNVTRDGGQTTYTIPDFQHSGCQYSWSNDSNFPLANDRPKTDDRVVSKNETALITRECIEKIRYRRGCISERKPHVATCETNCTDTPVQSPQDENPPTVSPGVAIAVPLAVVMVMLMVGGFILYYKRRDRGSRVPAGNPDQVL